jgi:hypothetical protein
VLLKPTQAKYVDKMLEIVDGSLKPMSICVNDGQGSADDPNWDQHIRSFLEALYGEACEFELQPALDRVTPAPFAGSAAAAPETARAEALSSESRPAGDRGLGDPSAGNSTASA